MRKKEKIIKRGKTMMQVFADWLAIVERSDELFDISLSKEVIVIRRISKTKK